MMGAGQLGEVEGKQELGPLGTLAALYPGKLMVRWSADEGLNRLALCLQAKAGAADLKC